MLDVASWLEERLMTINEAHFVRAPHRRVPEVCRKIAEFNYYSIPLANGTGGGVLASPLQKREGVQVLVILLHNLGFDATYPYWHWIEALNAQGIHVLSVDWDGHGFTGGSALDLQSATRSVPLLLQRLYGTTGEAALKGKRPGPACYLMGCASGAAYGLLAASRKDCAELLSGVIAVSPTVNTGSDGTFKKERGTVLSPAAWLKDLLTVVPFYGLTGVVPMSQKRQSKVFPLRLRIGIDWERQLADFVSETFAKRKVLRNVHTPVLWFRGAKDKRVPMERARPLMLEIPAALFTHVDEHRTHTRMMYSSEVPKYAAKFIDLFSSIKH